MKKLFVFLFVLVFTIPVYSQLVFPTDRFSEYTTCSVLTASDKKDTAFSKYVYIPQRVRDVILYTDVTKTSASDSLKIEAYQSPDNSTWYLTNTLATITDTTSVRTLIQNAGKYMKFKYYVQGASSNFSFTLKLVPK